MSLLKKILIPAMSGLFILTGFFVFFAPDWLQKQGEQELSSIRATMINEKTEKMKGSSITFGLCPVTINRSPNCLMSSFSNPGTELSEPVSISMI